MNPDDVFTTYDPTACHTITLGATVGGITMPVSTLSNGNITPSIINIQRTIDDIMDEYSLNRVAVDHKVTAQELLKLQEVAPDYASEIKENIAKNLARDITKKVMFKKKHDKDADVHHFIGRVWVFTDDELKELLKEASKNV